MSDRSSQLAQKLAHFGFTERHYRLFPTISAAIERFGPQALRRLYDHIRANPEAAAFFGSSAAMDHARDKQQDHWRKLFSGRPDDSYEARACGSAWKKDPGSGVIGVEKGPLIPVV